MARLDPRLGILTMSSSPWYQDLGSAEIPPRATRNLRAPRTLLPLSWMSNWPRTHKEVSLGSGSVILFLLVLVLELLESSSLARLLLAITNILLVSFTSRIWSKTAESWSRVIMLSMETGGIWMGGGWMPGDRGWELEVRVASSYSSSSSDRFSGGFSSVKCRI